MREEASEDGKSSRNLAEFCLEALLFLRNVHFNFIEWQAEVLKKYLLNQHIDFSDGLENENQQKETTHISPIEDD